MNLKISPILAACLLAASSALAQAPASNVGRRFPNESRILVDRVTGVPITALTTSPANDAKIYQTHPQWTSDNQYIIFLSNRSGPVNQAFAVNEVTGDIVQLTDGPTTDTGSLNISRKTMTLYFNRGGKRSGTPTQFVELHLGTLLKDSEAGTLKDPASYERVIGSLPANLEMAGGFTLDADEKCAYIGVTRLDAIKGAPPPMIQRGQVNIVNRPGGLRRIDLQTGEITTVIDVPFTMGHVQANPWTPGEIVYCNETGGDAPQRMWFTRADGTGNTALYKETPDEWITHEAWVGKNEVMFVIMGFQPRLRTKPNGIAVIDVRTQQMRLLGQAPDIRGFWHCNGSPDGHWAVGDTFEGDIYLINRHTGEITLLTTDHKMKPDHTHPTFSPDSKRILIQSGLLTNGKSLDLMVVNVPLWLQNTR